MPVEEVNDHGVDDIVDALAFSLPTVTTAAGGSEETKVDDAVVGIGGIGGMDGGGGVRISVFVTASGGPMPSALVETKEVGFSVSFVFKEWTVDKIPVPLCAVVVVVDVPVTLPSASTTGNKVFITIQTDKD